MFLSCRRICITTDQTPRAILKFRKACSGHIQKRARIPKNPPPPPSDTTRHPSINPPLQRLRPHLFSQPPTARNPPNRQPTPTRTKTNSLEVAPLRSHGFSQGIAPASDSKTNPNPRQLQLAATFPARTRPIRAAKKSAPATFIARASCASAHHRPGCSLLGCVPAEPNSASPGKTSLPSPSQPQQKSPSHRTPLAIPQKIHHCGAQRLPGCFLLPPASFRATGSTLLNHTRRSAVDFAGN
jgi:hypothetical protein